VQAWFQNKRRRLRNKVSKEEAAVAEANGAISPAAPDSGPPLTTVPTTAPPSTVESSQPGPEQPSLTLEQITTEEQALRVIDGMFASYAEYQSVLTKACSLIPGMREDGPHLGFVFDSVKVGTSPLKRSLDGERPNGRASVKVARSSADGMATDPQVLMQKKLEEEEKKLKKQREKWLREQAKADSQKQKESEKRMKESERELSRTAKESARCVDLTLDATIL
jgi:hypothetical protein